MTAATKSLPSLYLAGFFLTPRKQQILTGIGVKQLRACPHRDGVPFLHTTDFVSGNELYDPDWKGRYEEKLSILSSAARVISRYSLQTVTCAVDMDVYRVGDSMLKLSESLGHPYTLAARIAYQLMQRWGSMNSVSTPIKMILETRKGIGDLVEMFRISGDPLPSAEDKGLPQLQAADYIAWMRLKKEQPTSAYERVKASWKEVNRAFYIDQPFGLSNTLSTLETLGSQHPGLVFPMREDDKTLITFNDDTKHPRKPFLRTANWKAPDTFEPLDE